MSVEVRRPPTLPTLPPRGLAREPVTGSEARKTSPATRFFGKHLPKSFLTSDLSGRDKPDHCPDASGQRPAALTRQMGSSHLGTWEVPIWEVQMGTWEVPSWELGKFPAGKFPSGNLGSSRMGSSHLGTWEVGTRREFPYGNSRPALSGWRGATH